MSSDQPIHKRALSPISRRAFFQGMGKRALKLGALAAAVGSLGDDSECNIDLLPGTGSRCGYCEAPGQDYDHCDGSYCDYINYADTGGAPVNCGYCEAPGQDYDHCDGDYCDYVNYADT